MPKPPRKPWKRQALLLSLNKLSTDEFRNPAARRGFCTTRQISPLRVIIISMNEMPKEILASAGNGSAKIFKVVAALKGPKTVQIYKGAQRKKVRYQGLTRWKPNGLEGAAIPCYALENDGSWSKYVHYPFSKPRECVLNQIQRRWGGGARIVDADRLIS